MPNNSPIIVIEDDIDDQQLLSEVLTSLGVKNKLEIFSTSREALEFLKHDGQPFLIICDINLPVQNGIDFKRELDRDPILREKSIPFIFLTTNPQPPTIKSAYHELTVQGFFRKPESVVDYREMIQHIIAYWRICRHPND